MKHILTVADNWNWWKWGLRNSINSRKQLCQSAAGYCVVLPCAKEEEEEHDDTMHLSFCIKWGK
jgi:hypothetical protein